MPPQFRSGFGGKTQQEKLGRERPSPIITAQTTHPFKKDGRFSMTGNVNDPLLAGFAPVQPLVCFLRLNLEGFSIVSLSAVVP